MDRKRKIALLALTVAAAIGTGHAMQHAAAPDHPALAHTAAPVTPVAAAEGAAPKTPPAPSLDTMLAETLERAAEPALQPVPSSAPAFPEPMAAKPVAYRSEADAAPAADMQPLRIALAAISREVSDEPAPAAAALDDCAPVLVLAAAPGAMIDIAFDAPCHPQTRLTLRHEALAISGITSDHGTFDTSIPALAPLAQVSIDLRGGPRTERRIDAPEADDHARVMIQWQGRDDFNLHIHEAGAAFGEPGHIWSGNPGQAGGADGGHMLLLGDASVDWPLMAQVYSIPASRAARESIRIAVEAAVTPQTCGREMLGEAMMFAPGAAATLAEITLPMPDCDTEAGYLVLNNLLPEMNIALN